MNNQDFFEELEKKYKDKDKYNINQSSSQIKFSQEESNSFQIVKILSEVPISRSKSIKTTIIKWANMEPKLDIRKWDNIMNKPLKGFTLTRDQFIKFKSQIENIIIENEDLK